VCRAIHVSPQVEFFPSERQLGKNIGHSKIGVKWL